MRSLLIKDLADVKPLPRCRRLTARHGHVYSIEADNGPAVLRPISTRLLMGLFSLTDAIMEVCIVPATLDLDRYLVDEGTLYVLADDNVGVGSQSEGNLATGVVLDSDRDIRFGERLALRAHDGLHRIKDTGGGLGADLPAP